MKIFLDLDGVLADFPGAVASLWNISKTALVQHWTLGQWDFRHAIERATGMASGSLTHDMFWDRIHDYEGGEQAFWESLEPLPWALDLLDCVERFDPDFHILSSPSRNPYCHVGKINWVRNLLCDHKFARTILTGDKYLLADAESVLIDDSQKHCAAWRLASGHAVDFPSITNYLYILADQPMSYVDPFLAILHEQLKG